MKTSAFAAAPAPSPIPTYLTNEQCQLLLQQAQGNQDMCDVLTLALETGMRKTEMQQLRWSDVDFDQSTIFVRDTKFPVARLAPISFSVRAILSSRMGGQHQSEFVFGIRAAGLMHRVGCRLSAILRSLGVKGGFRTLRGTWVHRLFAAGASAGVIHALAGCSIRTLLHLGGWRTLSEAELRAVLGHTSVNTTTKNYAAAASTDDCGSASQ